MKRYYLSKVVGTGTDDDPYRPDIDDDPTPKRAVYEIPSGPDGRPTVKSVLCLVAAADHRDLVKRPNSDALPDFPLDGKMSALKDATRVAMKAVVGKHGFDQTLVSAMDGYRDAIRGLGRANNPNFHEDAFDVADVT